MRKIAVVTAFPPHGASLSEYGYHLVGALAGSPGVAEVVVLADEVESSADSSGVPELDPSIDPVLSVGAPVTIERSWRFNDVATLPRLLARVRALQPDAVIWNLQFASMGDEKIAGGLGLLGPAMIRTVLGIPTTVVLHNLADKVDFSDAGYASSPMVVKAMEFAGSMLTRALMSVDVVALTIPAYVDHVRATYGAEHAVLVPHGSFEDLALPPAEMTDGPRQIMAFGKWGTYKKVEVLVEAFAELGRRGYEDIELVIAGTDSPNAAGYLAGIEAGLESGANVRFTGYVAEDDVAKLFTDSTIVTFPYTSTTGSSGVLHQAGSYARACVLPEIGDFLEVIESEGFIGEPFEPGDAVSLADAIAKLLDDPGRRAVLGRQNFAAAVGVPMSDIAEWHLLHLDRVSGVHHRTPFGPSSAGESVQHAVSDPASASGSKVAQLGRRGLARLRGTSTTRTR